MRRGAAAPLRDSRRGIGAPDEYAVPRADLRPPRGGRRRDRATRTAWSRSTDDFDALLAGGEPRAIWRSRAVREPRRAPTSPRGRCTPCASTRVAVPLRHRPARADLPAGRAGHAAARLLPEPDRAHADLCRRARAARSSRIVFRRASYEHGSFLSARDHGRLADYARWASRCSGATTSGGTSPRTCSAVCAATSSSRKTSTRFHSALIFAVYGSAQAALGRRSVRRCAPARRTYATLFGEDIAILTGGGPGAMQQATEHRATRWA